MAEEWDRMIQPVLVKREPVDADAAGQLTSTGPVVRSAVQSLELVATASTTTVSGDVPDDGYEDCGSEEEEEAERRQEQRIKVPAIPFLVLGPDLRLRPVPQQHDDDGDDPDDDGSEPSPSEKILLSFFKCAGFPHDCAFYSDDCEAFVQHLGSHHPDQQSLLCFYCRLSCSGGQDLVQHMLLHHVATRFQCNLCLYRTPVDTHILTHHMDCHLDNYEATTGGPDAGASGPGAGSSLHLIKRESFMGEKVSPAKESATAAAAADGHKLQSCKVLVCHMPAAGPLHPLDTYFFDQMKKERIKCREPSDRNKYQCVYCPVMDTNQGLIAAHCAVVHPHFPLLMYMPVQEETPVSVKQEVKQQADESAMTGTLPLEHEATDKHVTPLVQTPVHQQQRKTTIEFVREPTAVTAATSGTLAIGPGPSFASNHCDPFPTAPPSPGSSVGSVPDHAFDCDVQDYAGSSIGNGYITDEEFRRVQTDLEMSDEDEGACNKRKKKRRHHHRFREEDDDEDEDMDTEVDAVRLQLQQRQSESLQERTAMHSESIVPVVKAGGGKISSGTDRKCLLCNRVVLESKVMGHLRREHGNDYALKCKDCDFRNSRKDIVQHIRQEHNGRGTVVKIIVTPDETEPTIIESVSVLMANVRTKEGDVVRKSIAPTTAVIALGRKRRKSGSVSSKNDREKGHLMRKMNEMTYLGPGRNERTAKSAASSSSVPPSATSPHP